VFGQKKKKSHWMWLETLKSALERADRKKKKNVNARGFKKGGWSREVCGGGCIPRSRGWGGFRKGGEGGVGENPLHSQQASKRKDRRKVSTGRRLRGLTVHIRKDDS